MGRYTTVQTISDKDAQGAAVAYDAVATGAEAPAATAAPTPSSGDTAGGSKPRTNRVDNVSGSSAGAGSGDFHTYRAARRRELERVEAMEQRYKQNKAQREFDETRKRKAEEFEAKMHKRADKRRRRKERAKAKALDGEQDEEEGEKTEEKKSSGGVKKEQAAVLETPGGVPEIPNDGSFLEKMLAMQKETSEGK